MAPIDKTPPRLAPLKRSLYDAFVGASSLQDEYCSPKYARTPRTARPDHERCGSSDSFDSGSTVQADRYVLPIAKKFSPDLGLDRDYRMSYDLGRNAPDEQEPVIGSINPFSPEAIRNIKFVRRPSSSSKSQVPSSRRSSMSMSTYLGNMQINGSEEQVNFLSQSHVSNHVGPEYSTSNRSEDFVCGEIILVPWYAPNLDENNAIGTPTVAYASTTGAICAKKRPVVSIVFNLSMFV